MQNIIVILRSWILRSFVAATLFMTPSLASAEEPVQRLPNPLEAICPEELLRQGKNCVTLLLLSVSRALIGLVAVIAVFMFIYGGITMLTAGGNAKRVDQAKEILKWTLWAIVIIFFSAAILQYVFTALGYPGIVPTTEAGLESGNLITSVTNVMRTVLGLLGIVGVAMMIWGGYMWLTAGGSEDRVTRAKAIIRAAVIGLIIIFFAWAIILFVLSTSSDVTKSSSAATPDAIILAQQDDAERTVVGRQSTGA